MAVALAGLGIPLIGPRTAAALQERFGTIRALVASADDVPGAAGESLRAWLAEADSRRLLDELEAVGLRCMTEAAPAPGGGAAAGGSSGGASGGGAAGRPKPLEGAKVVLTGSFGLRGSRKELEEELRAVSLSRGGGGGRRG